MGLVGRYGESIYTSIMSKTETRRRLLTRVIHKMSIYEITVENTGQQNSTTVNLTLVERDDSGCGNAGDLTADLSDSTVTLDAEDEDNPDAHKQTVEVRVEVPNGQEADDYCWEVTGTVTTPNPTEEISDTVDLELEVPVLKECSMSLSKTSLNLNPGQEGTFTATLSNDGNSDWSVSMARTGERAKYRCLLTDHPAEYFLTEMALEPKHLI